MRVVSLPGFLSCNALTREHTHFQKLIEQAEGVDIIETVVAEPVPKLAVITPLSSLFGLWLIFQVAVRTLPLQLLGPFPLQPSAEPAGGDARRRASLSEAGVSHSALAVTARMYTYGPVNSKTLLMVCLSTIMIAIWMNRSVRHPLGWHCHKGEWNDFNAIIFY